MPWSCKSHGRVVVVTMNTNSANAQNEAFFEDLHDAIDRLETKYADSPVVLTGESDIFSAGIDFHATFPIFARADPEEITAWFERYRATNLRLFTYPRPVVAAINGHAIAGGLITALACDYRVCVDEGATLGLNEVPIGIPMPSVYVEMIRYAVGNHVTALATLFGELYDPAEAKDLGFVHQTVPRAKVLETAIARAAAVPDAALDAYASSKEALLAPVLERIARISVPLDKTLTTRVDSARSRAANADALRRLESE